MSDEIIEKDTIEQNRTAMNKKAMLVALENSLGVVTPACKKVGIGRTTHYQWLKDDKEYKSAVEDTPEIALDFAESKLHKLIQDENVAAVIFYLKTKGKKRGYVEKMDLDLSGTVNLMLDSDDDQL